MTEAVFMRHVWVAPNGCWHWVARGAQRTDKGYGYFWRETPEGWRRVFAHRWAYMQWVGFISRGYTVDHDCHTQDASCPGGPSCLHRRCVNPDHLVAVTAQENQQLRGARITHCPRGHEYTEENTARYKGRRECRRCIRGRNAAARARRREKVRV